MNRLPEKLTALRKHYGYAQGDLAQRLQVPVSEYMNWENGNSICTIGQLIQLADIYQTKADLLVDNTKEIVLPDLNNSVDIPFLADLEPAQPVQETEATVQINTVQDDERGDTREVGNLGFEATRVSEIVDTTAYRSMDDEEDEDEDDEDEERKPVRKKANHSSKKMKSKTPIIAGICAAALLLVILLILMLKGCSSSSSGDLNSLGSVNRLALGDTYSLYIDNKGTLQEHGTFNPKESFDELTQVSAYDSHALGLKKDGTVVSSDADTTVDTWTDITMIAAGANHSVGLKSDGTVVCTGDENACEVSEWTDIAAVYAGNAVTAGVKEDGTMVVSGTIDSGAAGQSNVASVAFGKDQVIIVKKDGSVVSYGALDTSSWKTIDSAAIGSGIAIGLKTDHTLAVAASDETLKTAAAGWTNLRYIAANGSTIIGINGNGKMYGAGNNDYGQYVVTAESAKTEAEKLDTPQNIQVSATTVNIVIKWDSVENASYYEVTMDTSPETKAKVDSNQTSVAVTSLEDGKEYKISVTAYSDDETKYSASDAASYSYTFKTASQKLGSVSNIQSEAGNGSTWVITWDLVENADHYVVVLDGGAEQTTTQNRITLSLEGTNVTDGTTHNVSIKACSGSTAYTDSDESKVQLTYRQQKVTYEVTLRFQIMDQNGAPTGEYADSPNTENMQILEGTYDITKYVPSGYSMVDPSANMISIPDQMQDGVIVIPVFSLNSETEETSETESNAQ